MKVMDSGVLPLQWKVSAISKGYFTDPYVECFMKELVVTGTSTRRRSWARQSTMGIIQTQFLAKVGDQSDNIKRQIIDLGCGFSTKGFQLIADRSKYSSFGYFEIDFPDVVELKTNLIYKDAKLRRLLELDAEHQASTSSIRATHYGLAGCDLSDLKKLREQLLFLGVDFTLPTVLVADFVLPYIKRDTIEAFVAWTHASFDCFAFLDYSLTGLADEFGQKLVEEFKRSGLELQGKDFFQSIDQLKTFLINQGFSVQTSSIKDMYYQHLDQSERSRIESIEELTDTTQELFDLRLDHLAVTIAKSRLLDKGIHESNQDLIDRLKLF